MKQVTLIIAMLSLAFLFSCDSEGGNEDENSNNQKEAVESPEDKIDGDIPISYSDPVVYNDFFIEHHNRFIAMVLELNQMDYGDNIDALNEYLAKMVDFTDETIKRFEKTEGYAGNDQMRDAAIGIFKFYKEMLTKDYPEMIEIGSKSEDELTDDDFARLQEIQKSIEEREAVYHDAFKSAQDNFAKIHDIYLMENEYSEQIDEMNSTWTDDQISEFLNSCNEGLGEQDLINNEDYCNCMLGKIMAKYPNAIDAVNIGEEEMTQMAADCL